MRSGHPEHLLLGVDNALWPPQSAPVALSNGQQEGVSRTSPQVLPVALNDMSCIAVRAIAGTSAALHQPRASCCSSTVLGDPGAGDARLGTLCQQQQQAGGGAQQP